MGEAGQVGRKRGGDGEITGARKWMRKKRRERKGKKRRMKNGIGGRGWGKEMRGKEEEG